MPKLSALDLSEKVKAAYKAKKRDTDQIGVGTDICMPTVFVKAPDPIHRLLGLDYPMKRLIQIAGAPNSGKTTLAMLAMIEAQKDGCYVILADTERKFSVTRFEKMGGNPTEVNMIFPVTIEEAFLGIHEYLDVIMNKDSEAKILIVLDSLGGTPSKAESEADADQTIQLATAAKVIKRELRKFVSLLDKNQICLMIINQTYANIGGYGRKNAGGDGAEYYSSIILQLNRVSDLIKQSKGERIVYGIKTKASITKNHLMQNDTTLKETIFKVLAYSIESTGEEEETENE